MNEWPLPGELPSPDPAGTALPLPEPEPFPFWSYRDLLIMLGLFFAILVGVFVATSISIIMFPRLLTLVPKALGLALQQAFVYVAGLVALYSIVSMRYGQPFWDSLRWQATTASSLRLGAAAGVGTAIAGTLLAYAFGAQNLETSPMEEMLTSRALVAVVGLLAVTVGPLWEELTFRGFLLPLVSKSLGSAAGVLAAAFPFALMHGPQYGWAWQALIPVGFAGVCFGVARVMTGSTSVATVMHSIYNLTIFAGFLAQGGIEKLP